MSHTPSLKQHMVKGQTQTPNAITEKHSEVRAQGQADCVLRNLSCERCPWRSRNVPWKTNLIFILQNYLFDHQQSWVLLPPMAFFNSTVKFQLPYIFNLLMINKQTLSLLPSIKYRETFSKFFFSHNKVLFSHLSVVCSSLESSDSSLFPCTMEFFSILC